MPPVTKTPEELCDTDMGAEATLPAIKVWPDVPRYRDFRVMFDEMADSIDAALVAIPDFSHFPAAMHAMRLGKAVYVEKPLAHTFQECQLLIDAAEKYGVVTQMGNQGHSSHKYYQHKDYFENGTNQPLLFPRPDRRQPEQPGTNHQIGPRPTQRGPTRGVSRYRRK